MSTFKPKMAKYVVFVLLYVMVTVPCSSTSLSSQNNNTARLEVPLKNQLVFVNFVPNVVEGLVRDKTAKVAYSTEAAPSSSSQSIPPVAVKLQVTSRDTNVASVEGPEEITLGLDPSSNSSINNETFITIRGNFLGRTVLTFSIAEKELDSSYDGPAQPSTQAAVVEIGPRSSPTGSTYLQGQGTVSNSAEANPPFTQTVVHIDAQTGDALRTLDFEYHISVVREHRVVDTIFLVVIVLIILMANVGMGCKIDLEVIKEVTRRPVAPAIGMACQYVIMPLLAFAIIKILNVQGGVALGMFATGCAPGGGASNMYAYLLKGDVSLSVTMTFFSTMAALGLIPFWLFTLGRVILNDYSSRIVIPYANIIYSLLLILIPVGVGILLQRYRPAWSKQVLKTLRPVFCFFIIFIFTFGVYVNLFIFRLFTLKLVAAGILLPYIGFFLGGLIALVCRQSWARIKTIAVETGIQNTGVAFLVVTFTLPQPEADLSMVSPIIVATFTPIPMLIAIAIIEWKARRNRADKNGLPITEIEGGDGGEATFDQKLALNGNTDTRPGGDHGNPTQNSNNTPAADYPLMDDRQNHTENPS